MVPSQAVQSHFADPKVPALIAWANGEQKNFAGIYGKTGKKDLASVLVPLKQTRDLRKISDDGI